MPLVEKRYAEALVELSIDIGETDTYRSRLKAIVDLYENQPDFRWLLLTPEVGTEVKKETVAKLLGTSEGDKLVSFLLILIDKGRIKLLPQIVQEFNRLADIRKNVLNLLITSASPLTGLQIDRIKSKYSQEYKASAVNAEVQLDKTLIGGVKVKIGDRVIDSSIKGRLEALKQLTVES